SDAGSGPFAAARVQIVDGNRRRFRLDGTGRVLFRGDEALQFSPKAFTMRLVGTSDVLLLFVELDYVAATGATSAPVSISSGFLSRLLLPHFWAYLSPGSYTSQTPGMLFGNRVIHSKLPRDFGG